VDEGKRKSSFRTYYYSFGTLVMPFSIISASTFVQKFINDILLPFLDIFCAACQDDIQIYSNNMKEYMEHKCGVIQTIKKMGMCFKGK